MTQGTAVCGIFDVHQRWFSTVGIIRRRYFLFSLFFFHGRESL